MTYYYEKKCSLYIPQQKKKKHSAFLFYFIEAFSVSRQKISICILKFLNPAFSGRNLSQYIKYKAGRSKTRRNVSLTIIKKYVLVFIYHIKKQLIIQFFKIPYSFGKNLKQIWENNQISAGTEKRLLSPVKKHVCPSVPTPPCHVTHPHLSFSYH